VDAQVTWLLGIISLACAFGALDAVISGEYRARLMFPWNLWLVTRDESPGVYWTGVILVVILGLVSGAMSIFFAFSGVAAR
jgi:hypothetical protein